MINVIKAIECKATFTLLLSNCSTLITLARSPLLRRRYFIVHVVRWTPTIEAASALTTAVLSGL